jgi:serine protease Do
MDLKVNIDDRQILYAKDSRIVGPSKNRPETELVRVGGSGKVEFGITFRATLTGEERDLTEEKFGMAVKSVEDNSFAQELGLEANDIIDYVNRQAVRTVDDVRRVQQTLKPGDPVAFHVVKPIPAGLRSRGAPSSASLWLAGTLPE